MWSFSIIWLDFLALRVNICCFRLWCMRKKRPWNLLQVGMNWNPPIAPSPGKVGLLYQGILPKEDLLKADGLKYSPYSFRFMFFSFFKAILQNSLKGLDPQRNDFCAVQPELWCRDFDTARTKTCDFFQFEMWIFPMGLGLDIQHVEYRPWFPI